VTSASGLRVATEGAVRVLTIDRPHRKNAIDKATADALCDAIEAVSAEADVRGVVLTAAGDDVFVAGGDLKEIQDLVERGSDGEEVLATGRALGAIERCAVPVIAAVQGAVFGGGCELVLLCDLVVAEAHATFAFRHAKMGLSPAWGGLTRLLERVGPLEAARLLYTAESIPALDAQRIGLISEVVDKGASVARAKQLIARMADNARTSVAALKRALVDVRAARRASAVAIEERAFKDRWGGADHRAAMPKRS
jgi:enoyl-CoA hydratase